MKSIAMLTLMAAVLSTNQPAFGQMGGPAFRGTTTKELSADESHQVWQSVHAVLAIYTVGAKSDWSNPTSKRAGTATITKVFTRNGLRCAEVQHSFTQGTGTPYTFPFCQVADGSWKIAS